MSFNIKYIIITKKIITIFMETNFLKQYKDTNYYISRNGDVIRKIGNGEFSDPKNWMKIKRTVNIHGYECVTMYYRNDLNKLIKKYYQVHRLVYLLFNGEITKGMIINHKDGNKLNNNYYNLELVNYKQNTMHYYQSKGYAPYYTILEKDGLIIKCETHAHIKEVLGLKHRATVMTVLNDQQYNGWIVSKIYLEGYMGDTNA